MRALRAILLLTALAACSRRPEGEPEPPTAELVIGGQPLVRSGAIWRYLDDGSDPGPTWLSPELDDLAWKIGPAPLGYGLGNEATVVGFGPDPARKHITTYLRGEFQLDDPLTIDRLLLRVVHDDGAAVYLNGVEIYRANLPAGPLRPDTLSDAAADGAEAVERALDPAWFRPLLQAGRNIVAAEVHQYEGTSPAMVFDLALTANAPVTITRGPFLQSGSPGEAILRWRTNLPSRSRVTYGALGAGGPMELTESEVASTEHLVRLGGLRPATRYDYTIGTPDGALVGGDGEHFFVTPPLPGTVKPTRIWVIGDSGTADANAAAVYRAYRSFTGRRHTDVWLMLGDNAYLEGTDEQYQRAVFDFYPEMLRQVFVWPAIGNHETYFGGAPQASPYLDIFTLPTRAEVGGLASGGELYYSFDHGNIHFVALDSMVSSRAPGAPMWTWLEADLAANDRTWLIAYWHHPPYSKGSHDSDNAGGFDRQLVEMRERALPLLEAHGVDLVLGGHSHSYERSFLLSGHYGPSTSLDGAMKRDHGSGQRDGTGAYAKTARATGGNEGTVYVVAGSAGLTTPQIGRHPAMYLSLVELGSLVLDVEGDHLSASFLGHDGTIQDQFAIDKNVPEASAPPGAPSDLLAFAGPGRTAVLIWTHRASDETGFVIERATGDGRFALHAELGANASQFSDGAVQVGERYRYQVRASNPAGVSPASNVASILLLEPPPPDAAVPGEVDPTIAVRTGGGGLHCRFGGGDSAPAGGRPLFAALTMLAVAVLRRRRRAGALPGALAILVATIALGTATRVRAHGSEEERLAALQAAVAAHPGRGGPYVQRGEFFRQMGRRQDALADFARAAQIEPALPGLDRLNARVLLDLGRTEEARTRLERALTTNPDDGEALRLRARLLMEGGDASGAVRDLAHLLTLPGDPANSEDHLHHARALRAARQPTRAARALEQATSRYGRLVVLELEAIDLALERRRFDEALARVDAFADTVARKETWLARRGAILVAAGRPAAARSAYQATLAAIERLPPRLRGTGAMLALVASTREELAKLH